MLEVLIILHCMASLMAILNGIIASQNIKKVYRRKTQMSAFEKVVSTLYFIVGCSFPVLNLMIALIPKERYMEFAENSNEYELIEVMHE